MKSKNVPMRTCVGCRQVRPKKELIRIVSCEMGLALDPGGRMNGRGVYVCPDEECIRAAEKNNGLKRSLRMNIESSELERLFEVLDDYEKQDL